MRKRTVQSVLARRHMFNNGGMVAPQPQPVGILGSSPSLIDTVIDTAVNESFSSDMGAGSLSMAQGGVARFAHGGSHNIPQNSFMNRKPGEIINDTLTERDRNIQTPFTDSQLLQQGYSEEEINNFRKINKEPLATFKKEALPNPYLNPPPGEVAIINNAEEVIKQPLPIGDGFETSKFSREVKVQPPVPQFTEKKVAPEEVNEELAAELQAAIAQEDLLKALADATNKNTETNAVNAVVEASNMIGGEGGSVGADGVMVTDTITGVKGIASNVVVDKAIEQNNVNTDEDVKAAAIDKVEIAAGKASETGDPNDINALTKRIQGLLPAVKDDPQTEGLLIAMLGASIAGGTSSNAMTNIANGMQKALPALINYRTKQKGAKEGRQQKIAAIVIGEQLKRESEDRAVSRGIAKEDRISAAKRKIPTDYMFGKGVSVPKSALGLTGEGNIAVPAGTTLSLNQIEKDKLSKIIPNSMILPLKNFRYKMEDILKASGTGKALTLKEQNQLYSPYTASVTSPWEKWGSNFRPSYARPKQAAVARLQALGIEPTAIMLGNDRKALTVEYDRLSGNYKKIYDKIDELKQMDAKKLVGPGGVKGKVGDILSALGSGIKDPKNVLSTWGKHMLGGEDLSDITKAQTRGRLLLAKITPLLLGESGKTISDADRIRVARALGFTVETGLDNAGRTTFLNISGVGDGFLQSPYKVEDALEQVGKIISESYADIHNVYRREVQQIGESIKEGDQKNPMKKGFLTFDATAGASA